jgi:hypothetical protein
MAATLATAMGTPQHRKTGLDLASKLIAKVTSAGTARRKPGSEDTHDRARAQENVRYHLQCGLERTARRITPLMHFIRITCFLST